MNIFYYLLKMTSHEKEKASRYGCHENRNKKR